MQRNDSAGSPWRRAVTLALVAVLFQLPGLATPAGAQVAAAADRKIDAALLDLPDDKAVDFWVTFSAKADLRPAGRALGWANRGQAVVDDLQEAAKRSQAGVASFLNSRRVRFESYWIANTGKVTGPKSLMRQLAARPEVAKVEADTPVEIPEPAPAPAADPAAAGVDWNVAAVNAPAVWNDFGVTGQGIVVANLDTGVQFDHPALVNQYRGNLGGTFDHNYNWFDPSNICGTPSVVPCDNNRHGTHTMGTILGDDGSGQNGIGVAPGARWIAVKGCEQSSCSQTALLAGGQWLLAPRDLTGQNPRPDLRPNIVNNSWGGAGGRNFYQEIVRAWVAAGIFPVFSNGNSGPSCGTAGSPADYPESYAVGAHNSAGAIAGFSSRSALSGVMKPDIAAPGDGVRSSVPGGAYGTLSGTSMAAPHVAGAVALMWSAAPSLVGEVAGTRQLLDETAIDVSDLTCGGTSADNGVWGEGRLDALAAVLRSPHGPLGIISGTVIDQATGLPVAGARVHFVLANTFPRFTTTSATGTFTQRLPVGTAQVQVTAYGYASASAEVAVADDETKVANFSLVPLPRHSLSGRVVDYLGAPVTGTSMSIVGAPAQPVVTDAGGLFRLTAVPAGDHALSVAGGFCLAATTTNVHVEGDTTVDISLPLGRDAFGYSCRQTAPAYIEANTSLGMIGNDTYVNVPLPFPFSYYGTTYGTAVVSTNGLVGLSQGSSTWINRAIPDTLVPNATIYPFWDDLYVDGLSSVRTEILGAEPDRRFVIEWRNVRFYSGTADRFDFEVILDQRGGIELQYRGLTDEPLVRGGSATIGIENATGAVGLPYSYNQVALRGPAMGLRFETLASVGNTAPDAVADMATTIAGREVRIPVLANDSDRDGDTLDVTAVSSFSARILDGDVVSYTPSTGFTGTVALTYDLTDGRGGTDRATITLTVTPFAVDDTASTAEDTPVDIEVLRNDLNPQGGTLAIYAVYGPPRGSAQTVAPGVVRYIPAPHFNGDLTIEYAVSDGLGGLDKGAITITVSPVDDVPRPGNDSAEVAQDGVTTISVLANDFDDDGEALQVVAVSDPPHGAAVVNPDRTVTYRPDAGYAGADSFTYDVSDGRTAVRATVTMTVRPAVATTTSSTSTSSTTSSTTSTTRPPTTTTTVPPTTTTTALPPLPMNTLQAPHSVWVHPSGVPLDGLGTWIATINEPTDGPAQLAPNYQYGVNFGFASNSARGTVSLSKGTVGKTASLSVSGAGINPQLVLVPFNWTANGYYFLYLQQFDPGVWGALVYDMNAGTWTPIGAVVVPAAWGKLSPVTVTAANWMGGSPATCRGYPRADLVVRSPIGFVGGSTTDSVLVGGGLTPGVCSSQVAAGPPGWYLYRTPTP